MSLFTKEWCNLIFSGRNKNYGAYLLRKEIGKRYLVSFSIVFVTVAILSCIPFFFNYMYKEATKNLVAEIQKMSELEGTVVKEANSPKSKKTNNTESKIPAALMLTAPELPEVKPETFVLDSKLDNLDQEDIEFDENKLDLTPTNDTSLKEAESTEQIAGKIVEEMPIYPGGLAALMSWLNKTIIYPSACVRQNIEGDVEVSFVVNKDGTLSDFKITKSAHTYLDSEALRVVRKMSKWTPGKRYGKTANVNIVLPIEFRLK